MESKTVLKVDGISKQIRGDLLINNINFEIRKSEIVGLIGKNGAGKTTTIKMILGLTNMDKGNIFINKFNIKTQFEQAIADIGGFVDTPAFYKYMTAYQNLSLFIGMYNCVTKERVNDALSIVGLLDAKNKKVKDFSFGMKQRLGIAQAIIHKPSMLILDEPTNGLDPSAVIEIREYLKTIAEKENVSILISSHNLFEIQKICDRILWINGGNLLGESVVAEIDDIEKEYMKYSGGTIL